MRRFIKKQCIIMATLCMAVGVVGCGGSNSGNDAKSATQATVCLLYTSPSPRDCS